MTGSKHGPRAIAAILAAFRVAGLSVKSAHLDWHSLAVEHAAAAPVAPARKGHTSRERGREGKRGREGGTEKGRERKRDRGRGRGGGEEEREFEGEIQ